MCMCVLVVVVVVGVKTKNGNPRCLLHIPLTADAMEEEHCVRQAAHLQLLGLEAANRLQAAGGGGECSDCFLVPIQSHQGWGTKQQPLSSKACAALPSKHSP